jgi:CubicO group peptidase (beta-lactamase class C family)
MAKKTLDLLFEGAFLQAKKMEPRLEPIAEFLASGEKNRVFSGAQAAFCRGERPPFCVCAGKTRFDLGEPIAPQTLFDIASLAKVFTASCALRLVDRKTLDLGCRIGELLPALARKPQGAATLAELLAHEAGFAAWLPLFEQVPPLDRGKRSGKEAILRMAIEAPCEFLPGQRMLYSDLGFMVLGGIIEEKAGGSLDRVLKDEVIEPLDLPSVHFRPIDGDGLAANGQIAATEHCPWRGRVLEGEVHDDNAWAMGGITGHAGLFACASDLARFGMAWLDAVERGRWLSRDLAAKAITRRPLGRGLGWDLKSAEASSAGTRLGPRTFGHLGFTGGSLWVDPDLRLSIALLTNRVHPTRDNTAIRGFRSAFHDLVAKELAG